MERHKKWNIEHFKRLAEYNARLEKIMRDSIIKSASLVSRHNQSATKDDLFYFNSDSQLNAGIDSILSDLSNEITSVTSNAEVKEWNLAYAQETDYISQLYKVALQTNNLKEEYSDLMLSMRSRNLDALEEFKKRKIGGMNLSGRVWNYTESMKQQMEVSIDTALMTGMSADRLAFSLLDLLKNPDALFRRVRDENDELRMSRAMKAYHQGNGVYRSAYKNAMRLARSEINIAYRSSDSQTAQMLDCVVGIRINLSNNHTCNGEPFVDICDQLAGDYPKDFKFVGWHPQCRCFITYINKTDEEFWRDLENGENNDSVNTVKDVPKQFKDWLDKNEKRIEGSRERGTLPYFLKDNGTVENGKFKLNISTGTKNINSQILLSASSENSIYQSLKESIYPNKKALSQNEEENLKQIARFKVLDERLEAQKQFALTTLETIYNDVANHNFITGTEMSLFEDGVKNWTLETFWNRYESIVRTIMERAKTHNGWRPAEEIYNDMKALLNGGTMTRFRNVKVAGIKKRKKEQLEYAQNILKTTSLSKEAAVQKMKTLLPKKIKIDFGTYYSQETDITGIIDGMTKSFYDNMTLFPDVVKKINFIGTNDAQYNNIVETISSWISKNSKLLTKSFPDELERAKEIKKYIVEGIGSNGKTIDETIKELKYLQDKCKKDYLKNFSYDSKMALNDAKDKYDTLLEIKQKFFEKCWKSSGGKEVTFIDRLSINSKTTYAYSDPLDYIKFNGTYISTKSNGIVYNIYFGNYDDLKISYKDCIKNNFHPNVYDIFKGLFDHEMGHKIDETFGIVSSAKFNKLQIPNDTEISKYPFTYSNILTKKKELIAEAWSEFLGNDIARLYADDVARILLEYADKSSELYKKLIKLI